eukprot:GHVS01090244.1.p1 GENE.GHVS01090244.1~~GHVS01090244.1.p1  ORF type:complete len:839 (+),score=131.33 GHVS01090244.1:129-2645(+)
MGMLRSETMKHGTLVLPSDRAREFVDVLGRASYIQFVDMNEYSMRRQYRKYIQRIDETERILRFLFDEISKLPGAQVCKNKVDNFLESDTCYQLDRVEETLNKLYVQFVRFRDNNGDLLEQKNTAVEEKNVLIAATHQLQEGAHHGPIEGRPSVDLASQALLEAEDAVVLSSGDDLAGRGGGGGGRDENTSMTFSNLAGVILSSEQERFARTLYRATRGNTYTYFQPIESDRISDIKSGKAVKKSVFVIYFQGSAHSALHEKIGKICSAFGVSCYQWPANYQEASQRLSDLNETIKDKEKALEAYSEYFMTEISVLLEVARNGGCSLIEEWRLFCLKEKAIYATLNLFEGTDTTLRADCWFPESREEDIRRLLMGEANQDEVSAFLLTDKTLDRRNPPTYIRTTQFSSSFQGMVDTYGVARYKEANPAILTMVTFPFLFGVMYGDIGHGGCVLLFGLYLVYSYNKYKYIEGELLQMMLGARYMIVLMGLFATYSGFLYNDFFSLGLDIFGTRFVEAPTTDDTRTNWEPASDGFPYPFGFDPKWKGATNEMAVMNSFKMKFSVMVAYAQMLAGVVLKATNAVHFRSVLDFVFEFLPQIVFLTCLVGYMDLLIVLKWVQPSHDNKPKIISTIIDMFMFGKLKKSDQLFDGQADIQPVLVGLIIACVPLMLFFKPLIRLCVHRRKSQHKRVQQDDEYRDNEALTGTENEEEEPFDFGEEFIHQAIETIEFVLGTVSNTASYLRLWALSLAHQQLAAVFLNNTVILALGFGSIAVITVGVFFLCAAFALVTAGVMLGMDSLECFLHALRLQWVEFQNKFYKADGYKFKPFCFQTILCGMEEE